MADSLSQHITTLLRHHDCVIVPGVGAFLATIDSASLLGDLLAPPCRRIAFNAELLHDDGLLASSYARRMKISFEQAREKVAAEAALIHRRLKAEGVVNIDRVGSLVRRHGGSTEFLPAAMWTLPLPGVAAAKAAPQFEVLKPANDPQHKAVAVVRVPLRLNWIRVAAAAVILFGVAFALTTPIKMENAQHASLAAPEISAPAAEDFPLLPEPEGLELQIANVKLPAVSVPAEPVVAPVEHITEPEAKPAAYVVVIASLPSRDKAQTFIADQGIDGLEILQCGDKFRVYAASGADADQAMANFGGLFARYPDAWVCRR